MFRKLIQSYSAVGAFASILLLPLHTVCVPQIFDRIARCSLFPRLTSIFYSIKTPNDHVEFFGSFVLVSKVVQQLVANMLLLRSATAHTVHKSKYWLHGAAYAFAIFKCTSWSVRQDWNFRFNSMINTFNGLGYCIAIVSTSFATLRSCQSYVVAVCFFHNISYHISRRRFVRRRHKLQTIKTADSPAQNKELSIWMRLGLCDALS